DDKKYATAVRCFERAHQLRQDNKEASDMLAAAEKALDSDKAEKDKLVAYQANIDAGDKLMKTKNYRDALVKYSEALRLMPGDPVAQKKISQAEKQLDDVAKDKSDKEKYDALIANGQRALDRNQFDSAIKSFD